MEPAEHQLIERALRREEGAFGELMNAHQPMVFGVALGILCDRQRAEDVAQEVFFTVYRRLGDLRDPAAFGGWLRQIVRNTCFRYGKRGVRAMVTELIDEMQVAGELPLESMTAGEDRLLAHYHVFRLPTEERLPLVLHYCAGLPVSEMAEILKTPEGTLKTRMHRAREMLKNRLLADAQEEFRAAMPEDYALAEKVCFFEKLAILLDAGRPLLAALKKLIGDCRADSTRTMIGSLTGIIEGGVEEDVFERWLETGSGWGLPEEVQEMLREGERTGAMHEAAGRIAAFLKNGADGKM